MPVSTILTFYLKFFFRLIITLFVTTYFFIDACAQNSISLKSVTTSVNKPIDLEIVLNNRDSITAVQFDLTFASNSVVLPTSVDSTVVTNRTSLHSRQLSVVANNTIRVVLFNLNNKNISDTSGTILIIKALSGFIPGNYNALISNVTLANSVGQSLANSILQGNVLIQAPKISVNTPLNLGRIPLLKNYLSSFYVQNIGNQNLTIRSITSSSNRLILNSSFPILPHTIINNNGVNFNYTLLPNAKGNQSDTFTILSNDPSVDSLKKVVLNYNAYAVNAILLNNQYTGSYNTTLSIPVSINNYDTLSAFQFTIRLPDGIKFIDTSVLLNPGRITDHLVSANQINNNLTIIGYSPTNTPFKNNSGEILTFKVLLQKEGGTYNTSMTGCVLSDLRGNNVISDSSSTQIIVRSPQLQVNTSLINFGSITTKQSASFNLSVSNNGTDTLIINQILIPFSSITTTSFPVKVAPQSSAIIRFNFSSIKPINIDSSILIKSNDPLGDKKISIKAISFSKNEIITPIVAGFENSSIRIPLLLTNYDTLQGLQFDIRVSDINSVRFTDSSFRISEKFKYLNFSTQIIDSTNFRVILFSLTGNKIYPDSNWLGEIRLQSKNGEVQGSYGTVNFQNGVISNNLNLNVASNFSGTNINLCSFVKPSLSFSPSSVVCDSSVLISSSLGTIQALFKNDTIQPINTIRANSAANWSAIVSNNGCFYITSVQSTTKTNQPLAPIIFTVRDSVLCNGQSAIIYSSAKSNNQWFRNNQLIPNATDTTLIVKSSGSYGVKYSSGGCSSPISNLQTITIRDSIPKPLVNNVNLCVGSTAFPLTATALPGNTLRWYYRNQPSDTALRSAPIPSTSRTDTTNYYVSQIGAGGCESDRALIRVIVTAKLPTPTVSNQTLCVGSTASALTATALPGNTLRWFRTNQLSDTALGYAPIPLTSRTDTTNYYVSQIGSSGCESDRALIRVIVTAKLPSPTVSNVTLCVGSTASALTATASPGNTLRWYLTNQPSDTAQRSAPLPSTSRTDTTNYYVSQIGSGGCESERALIRVYVIPSPPTPTISASGPVNVCTGGSVILTSNFINNNQWYKDGIQISGAIGQNFTANQSGSYSVRISNTNGCQSSSLNTIVTVNTIPSKPQVIKSGVSLLSSYSSGNFWYLNGSLINGATDSIYRPLVSGNYSVQVRQNGCLSLMSDAYFYLVTSVINTNTSADTYKLFPNPVSDRVLIDAGSNIHKISFQIFDINGRRVLNNTFSKSIIVDISTFNSGVYTILLTDTKTSKQESKQIIKQ